MISSQPWRRRRVLWLGLAFSFFLMSLPAWAAETMRLRVDDYQIDAELIPHTHKITAHAKVKFTALEDLNIATFELHNGLRVTKVLDAAGKPLSAERVTQDSTVAGRAGHACSQGQLRPRLPSITKACLIPPTTVRCRASSWPTSAMTPATCCTPDAGFR